MTEYYESSNDETQVRQSFHLTIECVHVPELEEEVLKIVGEWEREN